jgi:carotenoid cleavage dioxygenase
VRRTVDIPVSGSPMMHDFSLTNDHVIIYDLPVAFDMEAVTNGAGFPYSWDPNYPARVGVMDRESDGSDVRWFDVEPCYVYHPLNSYDDGNQIVLDVIRHPKMFLKDKHGPNEGAPTLDRWTIDLSAGKVLEDRLDERGQEFPRIDERLVGQRHRFGYTVGFAPNGDGDTDLTANSLFKHDLVTGKADVRNFGPDAGASEFVFSPSTPDAAEDDGVLMGFVYNGDTDRSDLVMLDAGSLETVATVKLPARVPYGFHGSWVPTTA